jgi:hypothetical protein
MLTEQFVAAISGSTKPNTGVTKDQGIFIHEFQPLAAQRQVLKKSATAQNGIAISSTHIFAAQAEKAIIHVYNREKGNQEAVVPFPERIHSIALAAQDTVLLLGAESGRVLAWEVSRASQHVYRNTVLIYSTDLLRSSRFHVYLSPSACDVSRCRSFLQLLPLRICRCHDSCMVAAFHPLILARYLSISCAYPFYPPRTYLVDSVWTQLEHCQHRGVCIRRQISHCMGLPQWTGSSHIPVARDTHLSDP